MLPKLYILHLKLLLSLSFVCSSSFPRLFLVCSLSVPRLSLCCSFMFVYVCILATIDISGPQNVYSQASNKCQVVLAMLPIEVIHTAVLCITCRRSATRRSFTPYVCTVHVPYVSNGEIDGSERPARFEHRRAQNTEAARLLQNQYGYIGLVSIDF